MDRLSELAFRAYRGLVYETEGFNTYFRESTRRCPEIAHLNIGSRPPSPIWPKCPIWAFRCPRLHDHDRSLHLVYDHGRKYPDELTAQVDAALKHVRRHRRPRLRRPANPLLVSVRSGARPCMPTA